MTEYCGICFNVYPRTGMCQHGAKDAPGCGVARQGRDSNVGDASAAPENGQLRGVALLAQLKQALGNAATSMMNTPSNPPLLHHDEVSAGFTQSSTRSNKQANQAPERITSGASTFAYDDLAPITDDFLYNNAAQLLCNSSNDDDIAFSFLRSLPLANMKELLNRRSMVSNVRLKRGFQIAFGMHENDANVCEITATPIMLAVYKNERAVIKLIHEFDDAAVDFNLKGIVRPQNSPHRRYFFDLMSLAVARKSTELTQLLLPRCNGNLAVRTAIRTDMPDVVLALVSSADFTKELQGVSNEGPPAESSQLLQDIFASVVQMSHQPVLLQKLLELGARIDADVIRAAIAKTRPDDTTIWLACRAEPLDLGSVFLDAVNRIDLGTVRNILKLQLGVQSAKFSEGLTALMYCASDTNLQMLLTILEHIPGDAETVNERHEHTGQTALHFAASNRSLSAAKALLASGADPAIKDSSGRTALDTVIEETCADKPLPPEEKTLLIGFSKACRPKQP